MGTITALLISNAVQTQKSLGALRESLVREPDLRVVGEVATGPRALDLVRRLKPDVILVSGAVGWAFVRQLRRESSLSILMLLTNRTKSAEARHSFRAGGSAYCRRDMSSAKLIQALRQALRGHYVLDEQVFDKEGLLTHLSPKTGAVKTGADSSPAPSLSHREMDVLQALTQGLSNKEVARVLGISQQTVKNHMTSLLGKCQAVDRTQLTVLALRQGLVHLQDIQPNRSRS